MDKQQTNKHLEKKEAKYCIEAWKEMFGIVWWNWRIKSLLMECQGSILITYVYKQTYLNSHRKYIHTHTFANTQQNWTH